MSNDRKEKLKHILITIIKRIWFVVVAIIKFILFTVIPVLWKFLKYKVYPALHKLYMRLPRRRMVTGVALGIVVLAAAIWMMVPSQSDSDTANTIKLPAKEGKWAKNLISGDWNKQKDTTKQILQQLGMTVLADEALPEEQDTLYVIPPELTLLAMDAGQKQTTGRINLAELALMMKEFEFPFAPGEDPVILLRNGVQNWVNAALENPKQAGAEAPLFLYSMAAQQQPPVDLSSDKWMAGEYYLTYLELHVFLGAFYQALPEEYIRKTTSSFDKLFFNTAYAAEVGACTNLKNYISSLGEQSGEQDLADFNNYLITQLAGDLTGWGLDQLGKFGAIAKKIIVPISILMKIQKLAMLYGSLDMSLTADQNIVHKPGRNEADKEVEFIVTVGVDKEKYNEYLEKWHSSPAARHIKDCLSFFGLPTPTDMADIAGEVDKWDIEWKLDGSDATWSTKKNEFTHVAQQRMKVKRTSETHGEASFIVDLKREQGDHEGDKVTNYIVASAALHTDQPPVIDKFIDAGKAGAEAGKSDDGWGLLELLGLGNAAIEVVAGALQQMIDPVKYLNVAVVDHKHRFSDYTYKGTISGVTFHHDQQEKTGYIGFTPVKSNASTVETSIFTGEFLTETSSYTPDRGSSSWYLKGMSRTESSYANESIGHAEIGCIGGTNAVTIKVIRSGHNSSSLERDLTLSSFVDDGKHMMTLSMGPAGVYVPLEGQTIRTDNADDCEHVNSNTIVEQYESMLNIGMPRLLETFTVDGPFPEVIKGSKEIEDQDGGITRWEWHLIRQDPSEDPTYIYAPGG